MSDGCAPTGVGLLQRLGDRARAPLGVHLQVADRCNHTCVHCYQIQGMKGELSLDQVRDVLDDLARSGVLTLNVSGGEATLRHDLLDILAHARARGFAIRLYTNAFLVDDALADRIAAAGLLEVHVSVYSSLAGEHDAVTRVPGSFERTMGGVRALRARGVRVVLKAPVTTLAPVGSAGVEALAASLGCAFVASWEITPMEDGSLASRAVLPEPEELLRRGLLKPWSPVDADARRDQKLAGSACGVGRNGLAILPDGVVWPCTDTPVPLGSLTDTSLQEMLDTSEVLALFRELSWRDVHGCRDCDLFMACSRCHATALHEGGDYLGPYPGACARARARYASGLGAPVQLLAPEANCPPGRTSEVGPYRLEGDGVLRPVADVVSAADEALVRRFPWIRGTPRPRTETLVSLRRRRAGPEVPRGAP